MTNKEWNAEAYHRVSTPQQAFGAKVLSRLELRGDETVVDAGCGTGRLTAELLERLPRGRVIALDYSANMLEQARAYLDPRFPGQVTYLEADLGNLDRSLVAHPVDLVFSTATFHWVLDHDRLFAGLASLLKLGGRLVAQCGGGPNLATIRTRGHALALSEPYATYFTDFQFPVFYADAESTAARLVNSGFTGIRTWLEEAPTTLLNAATYREFLASVTFHTYVDRLPAGDLREQFLDTLVEYGAGDDPPFLLDYWRLNMEVTRA
jgi:trans-aconitate methyltransferase